MPALRTLIPMALRDTWQRALVYFGLAEDDRYADEEEQFDEAGESEAELEERYRDRSQVRRVASRRRDEIDDIFADEAPTRARTRVLRSVGNGRAGDQVRVHLVIPKNFNDAQQIADKFKDSVPVILNLQGADTDLSKRLIDFASGLTYALDGGMQRIAEKVFLLTPRNVEVSAEERARLLEKGFFNQS
jgi:cell division inhibitor SepF